MATYLKWISRLIAAVALLNILRDTYKLGLSAFFNNAITLYKQTLYPVADLIAIPIRYIGIEPDKDAIIFISVAVGITVRATIEDKAEIAKVAFAVMSLIPFALIGAKLEMAFIHPAVNNISLDIFLIFIIALLLVGAFAALIDPIDKKLAAEMISGKQKIIRRGRDLTEGYILLAEMGAELRRFYKILGWECVRLLSVCFITVLLNYALS